MTEQRRFPVDTVAVSEDPGPYGTLPEPVRPEDMVVSVDVNPVPSSERRDEREELLRYAAG